MSSFNSAISFVGMYDGIWFILFVSILSVLHSMFLNDGSVFFHCSWFSVNFLDLSFVLMIKFCLWLFCCILFESVVFSYFEFSSSFSFGFFVWHHLMCLILYYYLVYVFLMVFQYFKVRKTTLLNYCSNLISNPLTCFLKMYIFLPDLYHSFPVSFLWRVAPKMAVKGSWFSSLVHFLLLGLWSLWFLTSSSM